MNLNLPLMLLEVRTHISHTQSTTNTNTHLTHPPSPLTRTHTHTHTHCLAIFGAPFRTLTGTLFIIAMIAPTEGLAQGGHKTLEERLGAWRTQGLSGGSLWSRDLSTELMCLPMLSDLLTSSARSTVTSDLGSCPCVCHALCSVSLCPG